MFQFTIHLLYARNAGGGSSSEAVTKLVRRRFVLHGSLARRRLIHTIPADQDGGRSPIDLLG